MLDHPGPPQDLSRGVPLSDRLCFLSPHFDNAFPSGHALRATFLLGLALGGQRAVAAAAVARIASLRASRSAPS